MRKQLAVAAMAACILAPAAQAGSMEAPFEPALMMKLDFGGARAPQAGFALRLNYSSAVRHALAGVGGDAGLAWQRQERSHGLMFQGPALAQLDFRTNGAGTATLAGLPLVTRHVRNQNEDVATDTPADGTAPATAEDGTWYDYGSWGWMGWTLAAAGTVGVFLLASGDSEDDSNAAPAGGDTAGGGGSEDPPSDGSCAPILGPPFCI